MIHLLQVATPYLAASGVLIVLMLLTKPTRSLLSWLLGLVMTLVKWAYGVLASFLHKVGSIILQAHVILFRNFLPRNAVIPTVATKTTRRL